MNTMMMNSVDSLLKRPFSSRTSEEKIEVKSLGRPTPDLAITQTAKGGKDRSYKRQFGKKTYDRNSWICGCEVKNAVFCFPCLLFGSNDLWSKGGIKDLGHLNEYMKKHSESKKHINNVLDLSALGTVNIATQLNRAYQDSIQKHNEQVERNRYILCKIIDCIKFCGAFELALRGHDETETSENPGIFRGLVDLVASMDSAVSQHIQSCSVFKGTSKTIQNELLDCMLEVCHETIKKELDEAKFVALMADETTDISEHLQMSLVYRYEKNGSVHERFWGFFNPDGQNANAISQCILVELRKIFCDQNKNKIIAQTYDGASVMSGAQNGVQVKIKEHFPLARYIHCYAHQLNLIIERAASQNRPAKVFLCSLSAFPVFFARSPQRLSALETVGARRIPTGPATRWNFKSRTVNAVYENQEALIECFSELEGSVSSKTVQEARGLRHSLQDKEFVFWLTFFHKIMPHVDLLYSQIQARQTDTVKVKNAVGAFVSVVSSIRNDIETVPIEMEANFLVQPENKRRRNESHRISDAKEVCDRISMEALHRFESSSHLDAAKLLDSSNFPEYARIFPEKELELAVENYPMLNRNRLRTELSVLYERQDFRQIDGAISLLQLILKNNLEDTFCETAALLRIIVTIPMTTAEPERCFSSLKRIKNFLRNTMTQDRLNALAMLSIEKRLVATIKDFNARVIEKFANKKSRRMEFIFRH